MAEKPTLDELAEQGGRRLAAEFDYPYESEDGYDRTHWDALARAVLEAAGVPALLTESARLASYAQNLEDLLARETDKGVADLVDAVDAALKARAESAEARVARLVEALTEAERHCEEARDRAHNTLGARLSTTGQHALLNVIDEIAAAADGIRAALSKAQETSPVNVVKLSEG